MSPAVKALPVVKSEAAVAAAFASQGPPCRTKSGTCWQDGTLLYGTMRHAGWGYKAIYGALRVHAGGKVYRLPYDYVQQIEPGNSIWDALHRTLATCCCRSSTPVVGPCWTCVNRLRILLAADRLEGEAASRIVQLTLAGWMPCLD